MHFETLAIHAGQETEPSTGSITQPIYPSTTFERDFDGEFSRGYSYIRGGNPNRSALEQCLTQLEGGSEAAAFASGMAAASAIFQSLRPGDHVLYPTDLYFGVRSLLREVFSEWGLQAHAVDMTRPSLVQAAMRPETRLVWVETPSNPCLAITDVALISEIAHRGGAMLACDNTWPTPVLQRPFELGADIVMHSSTKYFGGHSDVMGGVVIVKESGDWFERVRKIQHAGGAVPSPFDCWLTLRGVQTLAYRVRAQARHAQILAEFLSELTAVERVYYPGLPSDPGHAIASRQMSGFGAMLSFCVAGGQKEAVEVTNRLQIIKRATSLGGTHSLIEHRASIEGETSTAALNLLRLSVGLEHEEDLKLDLLQGLHSG